MGQKLLSLCQRLPCLIGTMFAMILVLQYFELPYGNVLSSLFSAGKVMVVGNRNSSLPNGNSPSKSEMIGNATHSNGLNSTVTHAIHERANNTGLNGMDRNPNNGSVSDRNGGSNKSLGLYEDNNADKESSSENLVELNKTSTVSNNGAPQQEDKEPGQSLHQKNDTTEDILIGKAGKETNTSKLNHIGSPDAGFLSLPPALPPKNSSPNVTSPPVVDTNIRKPVFNSNTSLLQKNETTNSDTVSNNGAPQEEHTEPEQSLHQKNDTTEDILIGKVGKETNASTSDQIGSLDAGFASPPPALPPKNSSPNITSPTVLDTNIRKPVFDSNTSLLQKNETTTSESNKKSGQLQSDLTPSGNNSSVKRVPKVKKGVISISEMYDLLLQNRASYRAMKPQWSSAVDQELLYAKSLIKNAPIIKNDPVLYAPLYRNFSMFKRSYELMEDTLKVYIYREGEKPIFHQPPLKGIYASEGWFMKVLEANEKFFTKNPRKAHLFYLPFSSRTLETTLYVPKSHKHKNLVRYLKKYLDMIAAKHPFWNRTGGADHFLAACHDWAPSETRQHMAKCIRALCNADVKGGFVLGKDVSLPETLVVSPQHPLRDVGGRPPSQRPILAFFAGRMHGYLRPKLLRHWGNKDPDMKIFGQMPRVRGNTIYLQHMKSSKYCICARGYEVNSPRLVEAIHYECVPVIISDNFVPPFFEVLNWESFAVFVSENDIPNLKSILLSIPEKRYLMMQMMVKKVQQHFLWHARPVKYDIFHMILHSVWYNRLYQISPS